MTAAVERLTPLELSPKQRELYSALPVYWIGGVRKITKKRRRQLRVLVASARMLILCDKDVVKRAVGYDQVQRGHVLERNGEVEVLLDIDGESSLHWVSAPNTFISDQSPWRVLDVISSLRARFYQGNGLPIIREPDEAQLISYKHIVPNPKSIKEKLTTVPAEPTPRGNEMVVPRTNQGLGATLVDMCLKSINPTGPMASVPNSDKYIGMLLTHVDGFPVDGIPAVREAISRSYGRCVVIRFAPVAEPAPAPDMGRVPDALPPPSMPPSTASGMPGKALVGPDRDYTPEAVPLEAPLDLPQEDGLWLEKGAVPVKAGGSVGGSIREHPSRASLGRKASSTYKSVRSAGSGVSGRTPMEMTASMATPSVPVANPPAPVATPLSAVGNPPVPVAAPALPVTMVSDMEPADVDLVLDTVSNLVNRQTKTEELLVSLLSTIDPTFTTNTDVKEPLPMVGSPGESEGSETTLKSSHALMVQDTMGDPGLPKTRPTFRTHTPISASPVWEGQHYLEQPAPEYTFDPPYPYPDQQPNQHRQPANPSFASPAGALTHPMQQASHCPNCSTMMLGAFCHLCGIAVGVPG